MSDLQELDDALVTPDYSTSQDPLEPGIYSVRVKDSSMKQWKDGTNAINWVMETFNEADTKNNGRKIFYQTPIEGPFASRLKEFYKAAMHEENKGSFSRSTLYGREIEVTLGQQKNKPEYTEVKAIRALVN